MVYTPALVFGHGMLIMSEEDSVVERKFLYQITSSNKKDTRRGSLESCEFIEERYSSSKALF